jgi:hypothetical protein
MSSRPDPQDSCRIRAVSPGEYRTIAAEIARRPPIDWDAALGVRYPSEGVAMALRERLEQVLGDLANEDDQIAAMHGVMRSIGAGLRYAQRSNDSTVAGYRYRLDVNRIGMPRLWFAGRRSISGSKAAGPRRPPDRARGGHDAGDVRARLAWLEETAAGGAVPAAAVGRADVPRAA